MCAREIAIAQQPKDLLHERGFTEKSFLKRNFIFVGINCFILKSWRLVITQLTASLGWSSLGDKQADSLPPIHNN